MSQSEIFSFDDAENFVFSGAEISGSSARRSIVSNPGQEFSQDFSSDAGFTYDSNLVEFVAGLLRQKDQAPANASIAATYNSSLDASWNKEGALTANLNGLPTLSSGRLSCLGVQGLSYPTTTKPIGAVKFKYTPNYSGAPAGNINLLTLRESSGNSNRIALTHSPSGDNFRLTLNNATGAAIYSAQTIGGSSVNLSSAVQYEFELNWDNVLGVVRLFINGALHGTLNPGAFTFANGNASVISIGADTSIYNTADAFFDDVILFSTVQHTSVYTPGYSIPEFLYLESVVDLPAFSYTGIGTIIAVEEFELVEAGAPRYILGGAYWNGSAWVASDGTYAQSNDSATIAANILSLNVTGAGQIIVCVVFPDSNTISSVDSIDVVLTGQKYSDLGTVETVAAITVEQLLFYSQNAAIPVDTEIGIIILVDGELKYFDGAAWVESDGTTMQSNSATEISENIESLAFPENAEVKFRWLLSGVENQTPLLSSAIVTYDFGAIATTPATCTIWGYIRDIGANPIQGAQVTFKLKKVAATEYKEANKNLVFGAITATSDVNGYFEAKLIRSSEYEGAGVYLLEVLRGTERAKTIGKTQLLEFQVPDEDFNDVTELLIAQ